MPGATAVTTIYDDERPGMMRVHIADDRSRLACAQYDKATLVAWVKAHRVAIRTSLNKRDFAWHMAQQGLIDAEGNLRKGFPTPATAGGCFPPCQDFPLCRHRDRNAPAWVDKTGDVWFLGTDGLLWTAETKPFPREEVERRWGPLRLRAKTTAGGRR